MSLGTGVLLLCALVSVIALAVWRSDQISDVLGDIGERFIDGYDRFTDWVEDRFGGSASDDVGGGECDQSDSGSGD